jgi:hypothetical protein
MMLATRMITGLAVAVVEQIVRDRGPFPTEHQLPLLQLEQAAQPEEEQVEMESPFPG